MTLDAGLFAFHIAIAFAVLVWALRRARRLRTAPVLEHEAWRLRNSPSPAPVVEIIVPARNEAHNISACLQALKEVANDTVQVTVVDDHSEDATFEIAYGISRTTPGVQVIRSQTIPSGWIGKTYALHQGAALSAAEWLLFVDADVTLAPDALRVAVGYARQYSIDLLSLSPRQRVEGIWARLLQPMIFELLDERYDLRRVNDPNSKAAAANGQFVLIRRSVYAKIGGHEAIRDQVLEDVALAQRVKRAGFRLHFAITRALAETRMYRNLAELWEGWSKNLFTLLGSNHVTTWGIVARELLIWVAPSLTLALALWCTALAESGWLLATLSGALAVGCLIAAQAFSLARSGASPGLALLAPVGRFLLVALIINSWYQHAILKKVSWKGRAYASARR